MNRRLPTSGTSTAEAVSTPGGTSEVPARRLVALLRRISGFKTQSEVVARLTLLVAMAVLHRSGSVAVEPLHLGRLARRSARRHSG